MTPIPLMLLALCFLAHVIGDFVVQTEAIVVGKQSRLLILSWHVTQHLIATTALLFLGWTRLEFAAPGAFPSPFELTVLVGGITLSHFVADKVKIIAVGRLGRSIAFFIIDQIVHITVICLLVLWLTERRADWSMLTVGPIFLIGQPQSVETVARVIFGLGALLLVMRGGAILAWLTTGALRPHYSHDDWAHAGLPEHALKDPNTLLRGYAQRGILLILFLALPWWITAPLLLVVWIGRERAMTGAAEPRRSYARRELASSLATVIVVGSWARWLAF